MLGRLQGGTARRELLLLAGAADAAAAVGETDRALSDSQRSFPSMLVSDAAVAWHSDAARRDSDILFRPPLGELMVMTAPWHSGSWLGIQKSASVVANGLWLFTFLVSCSL